MNQILSNHFFEPNNVSSNFKKLKIIYWSCILVILFCIIFYIYLKYTSSQKEKIAKNLESKFEIRNLYSNIDNGYTAQKTSTDSNLIEPFVVGLLKIDKIHLMYPILSQTSDNLLEISPCRFFGPMPNEPR